MAGNPGNSNILVKIAANMTQFLTDLRQGLGQATQLITNWGKQTQQDLSRAFTIAELQAFTQEFQHLGTYLSVNQQQFALLTEDIDKFKAASEAASTGGAALGTTLAEMQNLMVAYGISLREAGQLLIANGDARIDSINKVLLHEKQQVLSIKEINEALKQESLRYNELAQIMSGTSEQTLALNNAQKEQTETTKKQDSAFGGLIDRMKSIVFSLFIANTVYAAVQGLQELIKKSQDLAQTQFELGSAVAYANAAMVGQVGTLQDWQDQIDQSSKKLKTFSKEDLTQATIKALDFGTQLGFTKDQIGQLVEISGKLAQRSGRTIADVLTELTNAIGGGRLQGLHDLDLYIRNADLSTEAWNEGLEHNVNNLSDEQRALVAFNVVLDKTDGLVKSTGDYTETLAGQMAEADTRATNASNSISKNLGALELYFKNAFASFLEYVSGVADKLVWLQAFIQSFDKNNQTSKTIQDVGSSPPNLKDYDLKTKGGVPLWLIGGNEQLQNDLNSLNFNKFFKDAQKELDLTTDGYVKLTKAIKDYADQVAFAQQKESAFGRRGLQIPNSVQNSGPSDPGLSDAQQTALDDASKKAGELESQFLKDRAKAWKDYTDAFEKSFADQAKAIDKAYNDEKDAFERASRKLKDAQEDALRNYQRGLADLALEESRKEQDADEEHQKKLIDNKKKYYDALKLLDEQYYFDIFDAVANNDAIALLAAERKYNLDKDKLANKYKDENKQADDDYKDKIDKIHKETEERRQELQTRYQRELEDQRIQYQREHDQAEADYIKRKNEIKQEYDDERNQIKAKLDEQLAMAAQKYEDGLTDIDNSLKEAFGIGGIEDKARFRSLKEWDDYYSQKLKDLVQYFNDYNDILEGQPIHQPPTQGCPPGTYFSVLYNACLPNEIPTSGASGSFRGPSTTSGTSVPTEYKIVIGSDGTVSEELVNSVVREVANVIQQVVVQKGG